VPATLENIFYFSLSRPFPERIMTRKAWDDNHVLILLFFFFENFLSNFNSVLSSFDEEITKTTWVYYTY
jgi:hypothetical protein